MSDLISRQPETHDKCTEMHACDCISRQAVIEAINKIFPADPMHDDYTQGITCGAALANIYVAQLPSAQPEIIRCKDCKHHGTNGCRLNCAVFCCTMPDDGFCSFGKRREDG